MPLVWFLFGIAAPFIYLTDHMSFGQALGVVVLFSASIALTSFLVCLLFFYANQKPVVVVEKPKQQPKPEPRPEPKPKPEPAQQEPSEPKLPGADAFIDRRVWQLLQLLDSDLTGQLPDSIDRELGCKARPIIWTAFLPKDDIRKTRVRLMTLVHHDNGDARFSAEERHRLFQSIYPAIELIMQKEKVK